MTFQDIPDNTIFSFTFNASTQVLVYAYKEDNCIHELYATDSKRADIEPYEITDLFLKHVSNFEIITPFETPQQILAKIYPELFI